MSDYNRRAVIREPIDELQWNAMTGQERRWYVRDRVDLFVTGGDPATMNFADGMAFLADWRAKDATHRRECVVSWMHDAEEFPELSGRLVELLAERPAPEKTT